ncbi:hypothetical protein M5D96_012416 [Drosophila gunungcola]|uniref:Selenoprotein BthD n=1 Tax=Drosophila gunungcola TaxID=103775 RepID=A0A9P9YD10_9MUSC|nr:hypothetical protein M5D96_012416 [Drosophila gunungcola]
MQLRLNAAGAPRRGAFELSLNAGRETQEQVPLWSGLKRGPPRALKFPTVDDVYDRINAILGVEQQNTDLSKEQDTDDGESQMNQKSKDPSLQEAIQIDLKEDKEENPSKELPKTKRQPKTQRKPAKTAKTQEDNSEEQPHTSQKRKRPTRSSTDESSSSSKRRK